MDEKAVNGSQPKQDIVRVKGEQPADETGNSQAMDAVGAQGMGSKRTTRHLLTAQVNPAPKKALKKKEAKGLTVKEAIAVREIINGATDKDALLRAGYSESVATKNTKCVLGKARVQRALLMSMERLGLTEDVIVQKHRDLLDCKKVVPIGAGDYVETEDGQTQIRAVELAYKVRGDFAPELHAVVTETYGQRIKRLRGEKDE